MLLAIEESFNWRFYRVPFYKLIGHSDPVSCLVN